MNDSSEWWEDFFRGPWGELQARGFPPEKTNAEVDFLVSALGLNAGEKVLDLACGTGRHSIELAARGMDVTGLDFNRAMLDVALRAASERGISAQFVERDMRELDGKAVYDAVICFWTSFGYFEDEADDLLVAKRIAQALRPGGRLLIDTQVTETMFPRFQERRWSWQDDQRSRRLLEEAVWNIETGRVDCEWTFVENGQSRSSTSSIRMYSYRELYELFRAAGFQGFQAFETVSGKSFALGARRLSLLASL